MKKPLSKIINGTVYYARRFSLAGHNEMNAVSIKMQVGDAAISRNELTEMAGDDEKPRSSIEVAEAAQAKFKIPLAAMMMHSAAMRSLRLRHSLCNADGVLKYKTVADLEAGIDADEADELLQLVNEANPIKAISAELEDAEKN